MSTKAIPTQARNLRRYRALFDGADTGLFTLPADALAARDAVCALADELGAEQGQNMTAIEADYIRRLIDAAAGGQALPGVDDVRLADRTNDAHNRRVGLLMRAIEQADAEADALISRLSDLIITEHLAPAVDEVMTAVRAAAEVLPDDIRPEALLRANEKARKAYLGLDDLAARYDAIRRAASGLRLRTPAEMDQRGDFAEVRNFDELTVGLNIQMGGPRPWPTDTAGRLLWYVRNAGEVWLPTVAQQDDRYREVHREALEQQQRNAHNVLAARYAFG